MNYNKVNNAAELVNVETTRIGHVRVLKLIIIIIIIILSLFEITTRFGFSFATRGRMIIS
jgi:hypothetical protein